MTTAEAIGILRGDTSPSSVLHRGIAEKMGAEALAFQEWLFGGTPDGWLRLGRLYMSHKWNGEGPFFDFAFNEWLKERNHG